MADQQPDFEQWMASKGPVSRKQCLFLLGQAYELGLQHSATPADPTCEDPAPPEGKRWFYCTTPVKEVSGWQLWRVAAETLDEAKALHRSGDSDFVTEEIEVMDLYEPEWENTNG